MAMPKSDFKRFDSTVVNALEAHIDERLKNPSDARLTFDVRNWPFAIREEIVRRYIAAGWNAKIVSDQRDGDFLELS